MGVRVNDILIDVTNVQKTGKRRGPGSSQRPKVIDSDGNGREARSAWLDCDDRISRWILDHIEGNVAKVTFVCHAIPAAKARLAIAEHVPSYSYSWSKVVLVRLPQRANRTVDSALYGSIGNLLLYRCSRTQ